MFTAHSYHYSNYKTKERDTSLKFSSIKKIKVDRKCKYCLVSNCQVSFIHECVTR